MKTIIAGSRTIRDYDSLVDLMETVPWPVTEIVSGGAAGVDRLGERFAREHNIPLKVFRARWEKYGKRAGFIRNQEMADYAEALVALWDGESRGTADMIERAMAGRLHVSVQRTDTKGYAAYLRRRA